MGGTYNKMLTKPFPNHTLYIKCKDAKTASNKPRSFLPCQEPDEQEGLLRRVRERGSGLARPQLLHLVDRPQAPARRRQRRLRPVRPRPLVEQGRQGKVQCSKQLSDLRHLLVENVDSKI